MSNLIIKDKFDEIEKMEAVSEQSDDTGPENKGNSKIKKVLTSVMILVIVVALVFANVFLIKATTDKAAASASESYQDMLNKTSDEVYESFYDKAYQAAEENHHVSNDMTIIVEDMREVGNLEVFQVYDQIIEIWGDDENEQQEELKSFIFEEEITSWLRVSGFGVFTVDLEYSEFITNEAQQYVLIRLPRPVLSEFKLNEDGEEQILFTSSLELGKNEGLSSVENGQKVVRIQRGNAERKMEQAILNNQDLLISAKESAETMVTNLVKQLNPHLPKLEVEVEFFD